MQLFLGEFGPARVSGRTLIVFCAYRGGTKAENSFAGGLCAIPYLRSLVNWLTLVPLRRHIASFRDYYANPRPLDAQIAMANALLEQNRTQTIKAIFDIRLMADKSQRASLGTLESDTADLSCWAPSLDNVDTTILVYPDAIGLTFGGLERRLIAAGARNIVVLTGRRRLFPLSRDARLSLRWRRLLASTRIIELLAGVIIVPAAALLAGYDWLKAGFRSRS